MWKDLILGASITLNILFIALFIATFFWRYKWTDEEKEDLIERIEKL